MCYLYHRICLHWMKEYTMEPGDAKANFKQAALNIGILTVDNFNKVLLVMTKHAFPAYAFCEQKRYLRMHLINLGA